MRSIFKKLNFFLNYHKIGIDTYGNTYYESKKYDTNLAFNRRIVKYKGAPEASKVPQVWHAWLHHIIEERPTEEQLQVYTWQKDHEENFTGTKEAYYPSGHIMNGAARVPVSCEYKKWEPKS